MYVIIMCINEIYIYMKENVNETVNISRLYDSLLNGLEDYKDDAKDQKEKEKKIVS